MKPARTGRGHEAAVAKRRMTGGEAILMKRIVYLFVLALLIGMALVYLRTAHMQRMYEITCLAEEEQSLRQAIWQQQVQLSGALESPQEIKQRIEEAGVEVIPPGVEVEEESEEESVEGEGEE